jgi:hypothetical protein
VELVLCLWPGHFFTVEDTMRQLRKRGEVQPYEGSGEVLQGYSKAMVPLIERRQGSGGGTFQFEVRWERWDASPWDWY